MPAGDASGTMTAGGISWKVPRHSKTKAPADAMSPARVYTVRMVALTRMLCQVNRLAWGPLLIFMARDLELSTAQKGSLLSGFSAGYAMTQILGGMLGDFYGGKHLQTTALVGTALGTLFGSMAATMGVYGLTMIYFMMGFLCGPQHPTAAAMVQGWTLPSERNWASAAVAGLESLGTSAGSLLAVLLVPQLGVMLGWRASFGVLSAVTWMFIALWQLTVYNRPQDDPEVPQKEKEALLLGRSGMVSVDPGSLGRLLLDPSALCVFVAHMAYCNYRYTLTAWLPTYFDTVLAVSPQMAGMHLCAVELFMFCTTLFLKQQLDGLVASNRVTTKGLRVLCTVGGLSLMGLAVLGCAIVPTTQPIWTTLCLCVGWSGCIGSVLISGVSGLSACALGYGSNYLDLTRKSAGMLMGVGNTLATLPTFVSPHVTAVLLESAVSWPGVFVLLAVCNGMAALVAYCFIDTRNLDEDPENAKQE